MRDLKPQGTKIKLGNNEYGLRFTLNAIDDIQEHFDVAIANLTNILKDEKSQIRNIRYLLTVLINEDIDCQNDENGGKIEHVNERYVGRHIDTSNISGIIGLIMKSFSDGIPESDDESPNGESVQ